MSDLKEQFWDIWEATKILRHKTPVEELPAAINELFTKIHDLLTTENGKDAFSKYKGLLSQLTSVGVAGDTPESARDRQSLELLNKIRSKVIDIISESSDDLSKGQKEIFNAICRTRQRPAYRLKALSLARREENLFFRDDSQPHSR